MKENNNFVVLWLSYISIKILLGKLSLIWPLLLYNMNVSSRPISKRNENIKVHAYRGRE